MDYYAYVTKQAAIAKDVEKKFDAAVLELGKTRSKIATRPPSGLPPELVEPYLADQRSRMTVLQDVDRDLAQVKAVLTEVLKRLRRESQGS